MSDQIIQIPELSLTLESVESDIFLELQSSPSLLEVTLDTYGINLHSKGVTNYDHKSKV